MDEVKAVRGELYGAMGAVRGVINFALVSAAAGAAALRRVDKISRDTGLDHLQCERGTIVCGLGARFVQVEIDWAELD